MLDMTISSCPYIASCLPSRALFFCRQQALADFSDFSACSRRPCPSIDDFQSAHRGAGSQFPLKVPIASQTARNAIPDDVDILGERRPTLRVCFARCLGVSRRTVTTLSSVASRESARRTPLFLKSLPRQLRTGGEIYGGLIFHLLTIATHRRKPMRRSVDRAPGKIDFMPHTTTRLIGAHACLLYYYFIGHAGFHAISSAHSPNLVGRSIIAFPHVYSTMA